MRALADAFCASWHGDVSGVAHALSRSIKSVDCLRQAPAAGDVAARTGEGFSCYALYPEQYLQAAEALVERTAPAAVLCVGLRSIGSTLAHVAAAAIARMGVEAEVRTLRPRGHPFDRRVVMCPELRRFLSSPHFSHVAIVDEGPGLSGSSFAAAAEALAESGVDSSRIVLLPSWNAPDVSLRSERGRRVWRSHLKIVRRFEETWPSIDSLLDGHAIADLSAGAWRSRVFAGAAAETARWPPVNPQHERRKYFVESAHGPALSRFAGLGRYGRVKLDRAGQLADAGFAPSPQRLSHAFLTHDWVDGSPLDTTAFRSSDIIDRVADYLAFVRQTFTTTEADDVQEIAEMLRVNVGEALGSDFAGAASALAESAGAAGEPRAAIDGRLLPHEWIAPAGGGPPVKTDALDHHADDFFPGCRDIAWDVAGAIVEGEMDAGASDRLVSRYARAAGDRTIEARLPFYSVAYLAYRLGYSTLCADSLGSGPDADRFRGQAARYRRSLAGRLQSRRAGRRY